MRWCQSLVQGLAQSDGQNVNVTIMSTGWEPGDRSLFQSKQVWCLLTLSISPYTNLKKFFKILVYCWLNLHLPLPSLFFLKFEHPPKSESLFENHHLFCIFLPAEEMLSSIGWLSAVSIIKIYTCTYIYIWIIYTVSIIVYNIE